MFAGSRRIVLPISRGENGVQDSCALGLARPGAKADRATTVRYLVSVEGEEMYRGERSLGPDGKPADWLEGKVPLARWSGRSVRVAFRTECDEPDDGGRLLAGFADSRIVESRRIERRRSTRDRLNVLNVLVVLVDTMGCILQGMIGG